MSKMRKILCLFLVLTMALSLFGCGKQDAEQNAGEQHAQAKEGFIGTWQGSDHDEENVVHYLIFDNDGYWKIYMNYTPLVRAIKQLPEQLVSFKIFCMLQNSGQTKCYYEYIKNDDGIDYTDGFTIDEDGQLTEKTNTDVYFTKVSTHTGEPDETIAEEAKDLFDRAREEALS